MSHIIEAGRAGRDRTSEVVLWRNNPEVDRNPVLFNQAKHISRRFVVSDALARVVAEVAFANGGPR